MSVYVDQLFPTAKSAKWPFLEACHLLTDGPIQELHAFAAKLQLREEWFQGHHVNKRLHHYDLTKGKRFQAIKLGAVEINDGQQFLAIIQAKEPLRTVLIGQRYEYTLHMEREQYFVQCRDVERKNQLRHGPFSLDEANAMIDSRIARDEALKR